MAIKNLIDAAYRMAYRVAYPLAKQWWKWRGLEGCAVAVWRDHYVLAVSHSYKPGLRLPGGGVKRSEDVQVATARELEEETGLTVPVDDLALVRCLQGRYGARTVFEAEIDYDPDLRVNNREIVYAGFVPPQDVVEYNPVIRRYLRERFRDTSRIQSVLEPAAPSAR